MKLKVGDVVQIWADMGIGKFQIYVNNVRIISRKWGRLRDKEICWVPFLGMWSDKDCIEILDMFNDIKCVFVEFCESLYDWDDDLMSEVNDLLFYDGDAFKFNDF